MASLLSRFKEAIENQNWEQIVKIYVEMNGDNDIKTKGNEIIKGAKRGRKPKEIVQTPELALNISDKKQAKIQKSQNIVFYDDRSVGRNLEKYTPVAKSNRPPTKKVTVKCSVCGKEEAVSELFGISSIYKCQKCY